MNYNQIYTFINSVTNESIGGTAITVKDTSSLVSLGNLVFDSSKNIDAFYGKLLDRIGKTYFKYKSISTDDFSDIKRTPLEFGAILQKVQAHKVARAVENASYIGKDESTFKQKSPFDIKDETDFRQYLFSKISTFEIDKVIYDVQLKSAFTSEESFGAFCNLIFQDMRNGMDIAISETSRLALCTSIATCVNSGGKMYRNLLAEYNNLTGGELTVDECLYNSDFLKFATSEIRMQLKKFKDLSKLYNSEGAERTTEENEVSIRIHSRFSSNCSTYLESDTYHNELVKLPNYREVNFWQGVGESDTFADTSSVNVSITEGETTITANASGIIAFACDSDKLGMMFDRVRTKSIYNPRSECTNYFHKADIGFYTDKSENGVVFYVA